jgi:beta-lactamase regulating signal transducer with metallopeptidase domain
MYTLGLALLHFIWQGAVVARLLASALFILKSHAASLRYGAAMGPMLFMPALLTATTWRMWGASFVQSRLWSIDRLGSLLPWVVFTWLVGVLFLSLRLVFAWTHTKRLKRQGITFVVARWQKRLTHLCKRMKVTKSVCLLESALVQVPTAIGWLRPVILLPASVFIGLTPRQLESILAHELAHVRRYDYFFNLLQTVVETLLFYHPAVWWISSRIRIERERCCDDIAVKVCGDMRTYARALAVLEELRNVLPQLAIAPRGGSLLHRIRRILNAPVTQSKCPAWLAAGAFVILAIFIVEATAHFSGVLITVTGKIVSSPGCETAVSEKQISFLVEELRDESEQTHQQRIEAFNREKLKKEENH